MFDRQPRAPVERRRDARHGRLVLDYARAGVLCERGAKATFDGRLERRRGLPAKIEHRRQRFAKARNRVAAMIPACLQQTIVVAAVHRFAARSAFEVHDRRARFVAAAQSRRPQLQTQIDVFGTVEERFVERADRIEVRAPDQHGRAAERDRIVGDLRLRQIGVEIAQEALEVRLVGEHRESGDLQRAVAVQEFRTDGGRAGLFERGGESCHRSRRNERIVVEKKDRVGVAGPGAGIAGAGEPDVALQDHRDDVVARAQALGTIVGRLVVDHDHAPNAGVARCERLEAAFRQFPLPVHRDDDVDAQRHFALLQRCRGHSCSIVVPSLRVWSRM
jgi:hypothetical protein